MIWRIDRNHFLKCSMVKAELWTIDRLQKDWQETRYGVGCSRLVCLWEGNYFFCSNYDSRHVCQISLANSQYSASNEPLNIWPDSLLFELWRADSDHVMCNIIILFDVKSITSLTADPTAHVHVVYNSDWIWWIKSIKCRLLLILEEEIIPDNQNENSRVRKLWNDQVPKTKMN